jgi:nanoRNase/pAp phosphatase (c-di-AMP/oligoRNAs hydrolase)
LLTGLQKSIIFKNLIINIKRMSLSIIEQTAEFLKTHKKLFIIIPQKPSPDETAAALALKDILEKQTNIADVATAGNPEEILNFLPHFSEIVHGVNESKNFVVSLDVSIKPLDEISYHAESGKVNIYLKSKSVKYTADDISFQTPEREYNALIFIGCHSLDNAGSVWFNNAEKFYNLPRLNLDISPGNESFCEINFIDIKLSSISELVFEIAKNLSFAVSESAAMSLLTGLISTTHRFQNPKTTPKSFEAASQLVELGANQHDIINHLYKQKSYNLLKLWGRSLARLNAEKNETVLHAILNHTDFEKTDTTLDMLPKVALEYLDHVSGCDIIAVFAENGSSTKAAVLVNRHLDAGKIFTNLNISGETVSEQGQFKLHEFDVINSTAQQTSELFTTNLI